MNAGNLTGRDIRMAILFALGIYLAIQFFSFISGFILVFAFSAVIAIVLNPPVSWLEKHKVPRRISAGVLALMVIGLVVLFFHLVIPPAGEQLNELTRQLPKFITTSTEWLDSLRANYPIAAQYLPEDLRIDQRTTSNITESLIGGATRATASLAQTLANIILAFIIMIYMLAAPRPLLNGFLSAISPKYRPRARNAIDRIKSQVSAWAYGILVGMFFIFVVTWVALSLLGIKQAFLFAVIAGLLEAVPIIGPILSALPPIVVALVQEPILALWVALIFLGIQQLEGNVLIPMIMSYQLSLHPVTVLFSVITMGTLFGIIGVFLAAPVAAIVAIVVDEFYIKEMNEEEPASDCKNKDEEGQKEETEEA